tara:strand:+ start:283 stop:501 length:219 start_codon:yes stop_codon:yes gene_type:complete
MEERMNKRELIKEMKEFKELGLPLKVRDRKRLVLLFKEFWNQKPTEIQFKAATDGLVLLPEMIYYMTKVGLK